jgi:hypothetical protein
MFCEKAGSSYILGFDTNRRNLHIGSYIIDVYDTATVEEEVTNLIQK